jgi:hypothetical protein
MRLNLLRLHLLIVSLFAFTQARSQNNDAKYLKGFDEQHIRECAKHEGIQPENVPAFIEKQKALYIQRMKAHEHPMDPYKFIPNNTSIQKTQSQYCPNAGFEQLNFTNWTGGWYVNSSSLNWPTNPFVGTTNWNSFSTGANNASLATSGALHCIMTTPAGAANPGPGWDPNALNPLGKSDIPIVNPNGSGVSMRLGNGDGGGEAERIVYNMTVSPNNTQFNFSYAVVLNSGGHAYNEQPFFKLIVTNPATGDTVGGDCGSYQIDASNANTDTSFHYHTSGGFSFDTVFYKKWTNVSIDLTGQMGQTISIEFIAGDCKYTAHYGYAYIDAECGPLQGSVAGFCFGSTSATLNAPAGFINYQWQGPNNTTNIPGATSSSLNIAGPVPGDVYTVLMQTAAGCYTTLAITLQQSVLTGSFASINTCLGGSFGSATVTPSGGYPNSYVYNWTTGPNQTGTSLGTAALIDTLGPGTYYVHITSNTCQPYDDSIKILNVPPSPSQTSAPYCGALVGLTSAAGQSQYQWYDTTGAVIAGATNQNYTALNPLNGTVYSVSYQNGTSGCRDSVEVTLVSNYPTFAPLVTPPCGGGNNGSIIFNTGGGSYGPYNYMYSSSIPTTGNGNGLQISNLADGTYTVTLFSAANPSCAVTDTVNVDQNVIPVNLDTVFVCNYAVAQVGPPAGLGTPGPTFHDWDYLNQTTQNINLPIPSTNLQSYTDTITYSANCKTIYKVTVKHKQIELTLGPNESNHCYNDSTGVITVNIVPNTSQAGFVGAAPYDYVWAGNYFHQHNGTGSFSYNNQNNNSLSDQIINLYSGTYTVTVTTTDGCIKDTSYTVSEPQKPQPILEIQDWFCHRDTIGFLVAPLRNSDYQWFLVSNGIQDTTG